MGHYVYKYVLNNEIIYIGKNDTNLHSRLSQHGKSGDNISADAWEDINKSDIFYCVLANSTMSDVVESELIRRYKPKYNTAKKTEWSGLPFIEPKWKKYNPPKKKKITFRDETLSNIIKAHINNIKTLELLETLTNRIENNDFITNKDEDGTLEYWFEVPKTDTEEGLFAVHYYGRKSIQTCTLIGKIVGDEEKKYYCISAIDYVKAFDAVLNIIDRERETFEKMKHQVDFFEKPLSDYKDDLIKIKQREGIEKAKQANRYKGRPPVKISSSKFEKQYTRYLNREINKTQLAKELKVSRPTLDKLIKKYSA